MTIERLRDGRTFMTNKIKRLDRRDFVKLASVTAGGLVAMPAVIARAQAIKTIKFGEIQALTGPSAAYGIRARDGSKMAVDEINEAGGFKDSKGNAYKLEQIQA